ncbi:hypothetical protein D3C87_1519020 [compost metagenome]
MPGVQVEITDTGVFNLSAAKGLRQQSTVVVDQHWNLRQQIAGFHHGIANAHFRRHAQAGKTVRRMAVIVYRQQTRAGMGRA